MQRSLNPHLSRDDYGRLLDLLQGWCSTALLVVRPSLGLSDGANDLLSRLEPFVVARRDASSWPGTTLLNGTAQVVSFRFGSEVVGLLMSYSGSLYDWQQPALPEDLCLLRADGSTALATIAHERDAYVVMRSHELALLRRRDPDLESALFAGS